jgi:(p)ppGpp synthase/HD superfamily hydrolase
MIDEAIQFAAVAHAGQVRKGTSIPYVTHVYAVGMMLARAGCDEEVIAAGILHDTIEDCGVTAEQLRERFSSRVAAIVEGASEPDRGASWEERKQHTIHYLRTAPHDVRLVACADKLHNCRTMLAEYGRVGERLWTRFKRGRQEQGWYYRSLVDALCAPREGEEPLPFCAEFRRTVDELFDPARHEA